MRKPIRSDAPIEDLIGALDVVIIVPEAPEYTCAECGTTEAETYVVTFLYGSQQRDREERTEICRACDDELRPSRARAEHGR